MRSKLGARVASPTTGESPEGTRTTLAQSSRGGTTVDRPLASFRVKTGATSVPGSLTSRAVTNQSACHPRPVPDRRHKAEFAHLASELLAATGRRGRREELRLAASVDQTAEGALQQQLCTGTEPVVTSRASQSQPEPARARQSTRTNVTRRISDAALERMAVQGGTNRVLCTLDGCSVGQWPLLLRWFAFHLGIRGA